MSHTNELYQYYKTEKEIKQLALFPELVATVQSALNEEEAHIRDVCKHAALDEETTAGIISKSSAVICYRNILKKVKDIEQS